MTKSIYKEAIGDLSWVMSDEFDDIPRHPKLSKYQRLDMCIGVRNTLEQAQKQEKLLALYKELLELNKKHTTFRVKRQLDIEKLIKELETNEN